MKYLLICFTTLLLPFVLLGDNIELEKKKINKLIEYVATANTSFYRNGDKHTSKEASSHMKFKYNKAKNLFIFFGPETKFTAIEFIDKIASKSSTTGKPYLIVIEGKKVDFIKPGFAPNS